MEWQRIGFTEEDKPMIEAVQRMMGDRSLQDMKPVILSTDTAAIKARLVMDALRHAEMSALSNRAG